MTNPDEINKTAYYISLNNNLGDQKNFEVASRFHEAFDKNNIEFFKSIINPESGTPKYFKNMAADFLRAIPGAVIQLPAKPEPEYTKLKDDKIDLKTKTIKYGPSKNTNGNEKRAYFREDIPPTSQSIITTPHNNLTRIVLNLNGTKHYPIVKTDIIYLGEDSSRSTDSEEPIETESTVIQDEISKDASMVNVANATLEDLLTRLKVNQDNIERMKVAVQEGNLDDLYAALEDSKWKDNQDLTEKVNEQIIKIGDYQLNRFQSDDFDIAGLRKAIKAYEAAKVLLEKGSDEGKYELLNLKLVTDKQAVAAKRVEILEKIIAEPAIEYNVEYLESAKRSLDRLEQFTEKGDIPKDEEYTTLRGLTKKLRKTVEKGKLTLKVKKYVKDASDLEKEFEPEKGLALKFKVYDKNKKRLYEVLEQEYESLMKKANDSEDETNKLRILQIAHLLVPIDVKVQSTEHEEKVVTTIGNSTYENAFNKAKLGCEITKMLDEPEQGLNLLVESYNLLQTIAKQVNQENERAYKNLKSEILDTSHKAFKKIAKKAKEKEEYTTAAESYAKAADLFAEQAELEGVAKITRDGDAGDSVDFTNKKFEKHYNSLMAKCYKNTAKGAIKEAQEKGNKHEYDRAIELYNIAGSSIVQEGLYKGTASLDETGNPVVTDQDLGQRINNIKTSIHNAIGAKADHIMKKEGNLTDDELTFTLNHFEQRARTTEGRVDYNSIPQNLRSRFVERQLNNYDFRDKSQNVIDNDMARLTAIDPNNKDLIEINRYKAYIEELLR